MFRNKFLRSCFALALALSMILPNFAVHADPLTDGDSISIIRSSASVVGNFKFQMSREDMAKVTAVRINEGAELKEGRSKYDIDQKYFRDFVGEYGSYGDPVLQLFLSGLKKNDRVEFITDKGSLQFTIISTSMVGYIHGNTTWKPVSQEPNQGENQEGTPGADGGSSNDQGSNENSQSGSDQNPKQNEGEGSTQPGNEEGKDKEKEAPKSNIVIESIKKNSSRDGFHIIKFTPFKTALEVKEVKVNGGKAYDEIKRSNGKPYKGSKQFLIYRADQENLNALRVSQLNPKDLLTITLKDGSSITLEITAVSGTTVEFQEYTPPAAEEPGTDGENQNDGQNNGGTDQEGNGKGGSEQGTEETPAPAPKSDLNILSINKVDNEFYPYHSIQLVDGKMFEAITNVKVNGKPYTKQINKTVRSAKQYSIIVTGVSRSFTISPLSKGDTLSLTTVKGETIINITNEADGVIEFDKENIKFIPDANYKPEEPKKEDEKKPEAPKVPEGPKDSELKIGLTPVWGLGQFDHIKANTNLNELIKSLSINHIAYTLAESKYQAQGMENHKYYVDDSPLTKIYIKDLRDGDLLSLVDIYGKTYNYYYTETGIRKGTLDLTTADVSPMKLHVRLKGVFESALVNQQKYDGISAASLGGATANYNSNVTLEVYEGDNPEDKDWRPLDHTGIEYKKLNIILDKESGMKGVYEKDRSAITLKGVPAKAGKYKIRVEFEDHTGRSAVTNELPFNVYTHDEKLVDHLKVENSRKMQDGKYIWDMEPWYIAEFDDETSNNTVVVPKEIKAWYGSHTSGTYGVLGMPSNKGTTQTLIVGKDTNLTLVNMKVLSSVKILVKDGGVLNLRDSSIYGLVVVQDGGKLQVNYDPREDIFTTGTSINGQIQLFDGAILDTSKIYSNTNFLTDKGIANRNVDPVVVANGNVTVNGKVFIMGDAAPTGTDSNTGRIYTGQHAMGLNIGARLHINKDSILGLYGGGKLFNNSYGGNALTMAEGTSLTGEGSLIAIPGNSALGNGATAIKGEGTLAAKQMYIQGGNTYDKNAAGGKALGENVKIDLSVNPIGKVVDGRSGTGETTKDQPNYWDYFNDPPVYSYIEGSDYKQPITAEQIGNHVLNNEGKTDEPGNANNDQPGNDNQSQGNGGQAGNNSDNGSTGGSSNSGNTNSGNSNSGNSNSNAGSSNTNNAGNSNSNNAGSSNTNNAGSSNTNNAGSSNTANNSSNRNTRTESPRERYQSYDPADRAETTVIEDNKTPLSNLDEKEKKEKEKAALQELEKKLENKEITKASFLKQLSDSTLAEKAKEIKTVFKDVDENAWYVKELSALKMASLINGYEDGTLRAERYITGKEFVTLLVRAAGLELVEAKGDWFAPYLKAAQDNGLLEGVSFDLAKMITREEIAKLAHNYAKRGVKEEVKDKKAVSFKDETSIDKQYMEAITCLYNKGILKGRTDGNFSPKDMTKRSEIIAIIYRLLTLAQN